MSAWLQFLGEHLAPPPTVQEPADSFFTPLTHAGLLGARGPDAAAFLHSQLTNDVSHLPDNQARLAGYCSAKGRMLASLLMWKAGDAVFLQLSHDLLPAIRKRLQMFVLRAKVVLDDETPNRALLGLTGDGAVRFLSGRFPALPARPFDLCHGDSGSVIRLPDALGRNRFQWITTAAEAIAAWPAMSQSMTLHDNAAWRHMDVLAGIPHIVTATQDKFVPQMVNYELLGGVNFKKGCYPGQEIVARSQYLGKLKRRMVLASVESLEVQPGMEIFSSHDPAQPSGMVVNAEPSGTSQSDCLVEIKLASMEGGTLHLQSADGPPLTLRGLPYSLAEPA